ncbi:MAG: DUF2752 domain-containing protein [Acidobacteria bacterium]|nr:DUF2752 domain-containing protein [Acidobacteriota bacterium]
MPSRRWAADPDLRWIRRLAAAGLLMVAVAIVTFRLLQPAPDGHGTHEQLGLPPCLFRQILSIDRCPSCGLTTAFVLAYQGDLSRALESNPLILLWFPLHILAIPYLARLWWRPSVRWLCDGSIVLAAAMVLHAVYWLAGMTALLWV